MGLSRIIYFCCESIKESFAALRVPTGKRQNFGAASLSRARQWGWAPHIEKIYVVDREGRAGRRIAELRLVECFGGRLCHCSGEQWAMAERWNLRPVQRRRRA